MNIQSLLAQNEEKLIFVSPEDTLQTAAFLLSHNRIGAMPVCDTNKKVVGVISERDIVRVVANKPDDIKVLYIKDAMTHAVVTCGLDDSVADAMASMDKAHVRHLPVVENGKLRGMISSRDTIRCALNAMETERNVLRDYALTR